MKVVSTPELQLGDIVHCHGGRFELVSYLVDEAQAAKTAELLRLHPYRGDTPEMIERNAKREETLRAFATRYLGPMDERWPCSVPQDWRDSPGRPDGWHIQGNHNAMWAVEA
jgi:hypothetical protein